MKKKSNTVITIIQCLLALACAGYCIYTVINGAGSGGQQWPAIACLLALGATLDYMFRGYRKSAARAYRLMILSCALASLLCLIPHTFNHTVTAEAPVASALCAIGYAMAFGAYLLIAFVPDLGEAKSAALLGFIFLVHLAVFTCCLILQPGKLIGNGTIFDSMRAARHFSILVLTVNAALCTHFKYVDKAERHAILSNRKKNADPGAGSAS